jgi:hypothetical protein
MLLSTPSLRRTTTLRGLVLGMEQERSSAWRLLKTVTAMDVVYALKRQGRTLYGFEEMGFVGVGCIGEGEMDLEEREMGFERGGREIWGGGGHGRRWEEEIEKT